jgi:hypothetical protein
MNIQHPSLFLLSSLLLTFLTAQPTVESFKQAEVSGSGFTAPWKSNSGTSIENDTALRGESLTFGSLVVEGGRIQSLYFQDTLKLRTPKKISDGDVYVSYLLRPIKRDFRFSTNFEGVGGVINEDGNLILAGIQWANEEPFLLSVKSNEDGTPGSYTIAEAPKDQTILVVLKLRSHSDGTMVTAHFLWDPSALEALRGGAQPPAGKGAMGSFISPGTSEVHGIQILSYGIDMSFDEFRVGGSLQEVLPLKGN